MREMARMSVCRESIWVNEHEEGEQEEEEYEEQEQVLMMLYL